MNKHYLLLVPLLLLATTLFSQPSNERQARQVLIEGEELSKEKKYEASNQKFEQALGFYELDSTNYRPQIFQAKMGLALNYRRTKQFDTALSMYQAIAPWKAFAPNDRERLGCEIGLGVCYFKLNQPALAKWHLKKAEAFYESEMRREKFLPISQALSYLGNIYRNQSMEDSAIYYYRKTVEADRHYFGTEKNARVGLDYIVLGTAYQQDDLFREAIDNYNRGVAIIREAAGPEHEDLIQGYTYLSTAYSRTGELHKAEAFFKQAEALIHKHFPPGHFFHGVLYSNGSELYRMMGEQGEAVDMQAEALRIFEDKLPPGHFNIAMSQLNLGLALNQVNRYYDAIGYLRACNEAVVPKYGENHYLLAMSYNGIGEAYIKLGKYGQALAALDHSLAVAEEVSVRPHQYFAGPNFNKAELFRKQHRYGQAVEHYQRALEGLGYDKNVPGQVLDFKRVKTLLDILDGQASTYLEQFRRSRKAESLSQSLRTYHSGMEVLDHVIASFREEDISNLTSQFYSFMESAVGAHYDAYRQTGQAKYLAKAYELVERSKGILLYKATLNNTARAYASIPEDMLTEEQAIKRRIANLAAAIDEATQEGKAKTDTTLINLNAQLAEEQTRLEAFLRQLEEEYPRYYRLKYAIQVLPVEEIQAGLSPQQAQLAYFIGEKLRLAFVFTSDNFRAVQLPGDYPLADWSRRLCLSIYGGQIDAGVYVQNAYRLYEKLVQPLEPLPEQLIIIPDGPLYYLPFEVLLSDMPERAAAFHRHPYLLHRYQMAYSFSATLSKAMARQPASGEELLVVAPSFGSAQQTKYENYRRDNLGPLLYNEQEAAAIQRIMGAGLLTGEGASLQEFQRIASAYSLFHFATHAKADDYNSDHSYLAFAGAGQGDPNAKLHLRDLYTFYLPAKMVVLSACEAGLGEFQRGEGVLSLARGFAYAGAKSIVTSLWAANDQATARLMERYYRQLEEGKTIDAALRQAKLDYLAAATEPADAHPFKWGAFIAIGDMEALNAGKPGLGRWALIGGVLLLLLLVLWRRWSS